MNAIKQEIVKLSKKFEKILIIYQSYLAIDLLDYNFVQALHLKDPGTKSNFKSEFLFKSNFFMLNDILLSSFIMCYLNCTRCKISPMFFFNLNY